MKLTFDGTTSNQSSWPLIAKILVSSLCHFLGQDFRILELWNWWQHPSTFHPNSNGFFAETGCRSHNGDRYEKCKTNNKCIRADLIASDCPKVSDVSTEHPPVTPISQGCDEGKWSCLNGKCIKLSQVCDTIQDCGGDDTSDEEAGKSPLKLSSTVKLPKLTL